MLQQNGPDLGRQPITWSSHPIILDQQLFNMFGHEYYTWDPAVLLIEMKTRGAADIGTESAANAIQLALGTTAPYEDWFVFEKTVWGLTEYPPAFKYVQPPSINQLYVACSTMWYWRKAGEAPQEDGYSSLFNEEVLDYIAALFIENRIPYVAQPFSFCQKLVTKHLRVDPVLYEEDYHGEKQLPQSSILQGCEAGVARFYERMGEDTDLLTAQSEFTVRPEHVYGLAQKLGFDMKGEFARDILKGVGKQTFYDMDSGELKIAAVLIMRSSKGNK